jgi:4-amino-4-deoxy-L-arabinose transferase-like glycosyltransferase
MHEAQTLAIILGCLLVFRLLALYLNRTNLFFDEAQYWSWSLTPDFGYYSKPPLIAWLIWGMTSVCGHGEACIRAASPLAHTLTAWLVYLIGRHLYDTRTGFWSAVTVATLPGVSFSAGIISTDVPLLACWAGALLGFVRLMDDPGKSWGPVALLGAAIGLGLNAKYAMAYFLPCAGLFLVTTPARRWLFRDLRLYAALGIAGLMIAPNIAWNARNSFATFGHTADNANWGRALFHPAKMAEFALAQFGVFGPILFAMLLWCGWQAWKRRRPEATRLLLWLSLPVLGVITAQSFLSRAHANWAAVTYVGASLVVVEALLRSSAGWRWLRGSLALHAGVMAVLAGGLAMAGHVRLPVKADPFERVLGWKDLGQAVSQELAQARLAQRPYRAVLTDERLLTATLLYYMRAEETPLLAWRAPGAKPRDHFELTRAYQATSGEPVLLVSLNPNAAGIPAHFAIAKRLQPLSVPTGTGVNRTLHLFELAGLKRP